MFSDHVKQKSEKLLFHEEGREERENSTAKQLQLPQSSGGPITKGSENGKW